MTTPEPGRRRPLPPASAAPANPPPARPQVAKLASTRPDVTHAPQQAPVAVSGAERSVCMAKTPPCHVGGFGRSGSAEARASLRQIRDVIREEMEEGSCHLHLPPPNDTAAEAWILVGILVGLWHPDELGGLTLEDFYHNDYGVLYGYLEVIARRWPPSEHRQISDADVLDMVKRSGLETIGCEVLLEELRTAQVPVFGCTKAAAKKLKRLAVYRRVLRTMLEAEAELRNAGEPWNGGGRFDGMMGRPAPNNVKANVVSLLAEAQRLMGGVE